MPWRNILINQEAIYRTEKKESSYSPIRQYTDYGNPIHYSVQSSVFRNQYTMFYIQSPVFILFLKLNMKNSQIFKCCIFYCLLTCHMKQDPGTRLP